VKESSVIYKRQFSLLIFVMLFTFKLSKLPSILAENVKSSGTLTVFLYLLLEAVSFAFVYAIMKKGNVDELLDGKSKWAYKAMLTVVFACFLLKLCLMYAGVVTFVLEQLFENISVTGIALALIVPVAYLAAKGIRVISRTTEIFIWYIAVVLVFNVIFLKVRPDFMRNLPLLNAPLPEYAAEGSKFFFWFGDFTPFMFVALKDDKKAKPWGMFLFVSLVVVFGIALMYSMYGNSAVYIGNFIVKLASFNQFADKLGRLDWTGMIAWLIMAIIFLSVYLWALLEVGERVIKRRRTIFVFAILTLLAVKILLPDLSKIVEFVQGKVRYLAVAVNYFVPVIIYLWLMQRRKNTAENGYDFVLNKLNSVETNNE
jgi:Spore germination protein.